MVENLVEAEKSYDQRRDLLENMDSNPEVTSNLSHLTLSETVMEYIDDNPILEPLRPLCDQIMATGSYSEREVRLYQNMIDAMIIRFKINADEDDQSGYECLDVIKLYLQQFISGCGGGFRAGMATESRRRSSYEVVEPPQKRRWGQ